MNSWIKNTLKISSYEEMNKLAALAPPGSDGLLFHPFGNGAERIFENKNPGAGLKNLQFNRHNTSHMLRAAQEGIAFAFNYGMEIMDEMNARPRIVRAGETNMFLSPLFRQIFTSVTGTVLELYQTDGSQGAARGAALGVRYYSGFKEAFQKLERRMTVAPDKKTAPIYKEAYLEWKKHLKK